MFLGLDFIAYSSHKSGTHRITKMFENHTLNCGYFHSITDLWVTFDHCRNKTKDQIKDIFLNALKDYKEKKGRRLRFISVVRNPTERLLSSFFQTYDLDERKFNKIVSNKTTVFTHNAEELLKIYEDKIEKRELPGDFESMDEMSWIFDTNIIQKLQKRSDHFIYENDLVQLYVLDYEKLRKDNYKYLNNTLNILLTEPGIPDDNNHNKHKYEEMRKKITYSTKKKIFDTYTPFYFSAFIKPGYKSTFGYGIIFKNEEIERILEYGNQLEWEYGKVPTEMDKEYRFSKIRWIPKNKETSWIYERIYDFVQQSNRESWNFSIEGFAAKIQLSEYEVDSHYDWHTDVGENCAHRKISVSVQLTDPSEYEGGELQAMTNKDVQIAPKTKGTAVVFPSYFLHKVSKVKKGTRKSLVAWIGGPALH